MSDQTITSLIEKLEAGPVYLTHKEAYDLAISFGSDTAFGLAQIIRKAFAGGSLDAALALAERVLGEEVALSILQDTVDGWNAAAGLSIRNLPRLLCAAVLRAQSEARV